MLSSKGAWGKELRAALKTDADINEWRVGEVPSILWVLCFPHLLEISHESGSWVAGKTNILLLAGIITASVVPLPREVWVLLHFLLVLRLVGPGGSNVHRLIKLLQVLSDLPQGGRGLCRAVGRFEVEDAAVELVLREVATEDELFGYFLLGVACAKNLPGGWALGFVLVETSVGRAGKVGWETDCFELRNGTGRW